MESSGGNTRAFLYLIMTKSLIGKNDWVVLYALVFLGLLVNLIGLNSGFISDDSGLYALLSKNLLDSGDWYKLETYGKDWLDKPHFQFWVTAPFIKVLGNVSLAYRLPSILFFLCGVYFIYLLGYRLGDRFTALLGVLFFLTTEHILISNLDLRAETMLIGLVVPGMYYLLKLLDKFTLKSLVLSSLFSACAIMTKGLVVLIPPFFGILLYYLFSSNFKGMIHVKWLLFIVLTFLFLIPELSALYLQFDSQPDKLVFGQEGVSGIKWFLWDSQFGRFLGKGPISRPESFVWEYWLNLLWAMAPWVLLFVPCAFILLKGYIKKKKTPDATFVLLGGTLVTMLIFSLSSFQLPHYTNILYPFCAVILACCFREIHREKWSITVLKISAILILIGFILLTYWFLEVWQVGLSSVVLFLSFFFILRTRFKWVFVNALGLVCLNLFSFIYFFPRFLKAKPEQEVARFINEKYPRENVLLFDLEKVSHRFAYYLDASAEMTSIDSIKKTDHYKLVLVQDKWDDVLRWNGNKTQQLKSWKYEPGEKIDLSLFDASEGRKTRKWFLIRVNP